MFVYVCTYMLCLCVWSAENNFDSISKDSAHVFFETGYLIGLELAYLHKLASHPAFGVLFSPCQCWDCLHALPHLILIFTWVLV